VSDNVVTVNKIGILLESCHPLGEDVLRFKWSMGAMPLTGATQNGLLFENPEPEPLR